MDRSLLRHDTKSTHRSFALVLAGGGVRGMAHAGVLHALEYYGWRPSAIVGVSMGAIVGATYALNPHWYEALVNMDTAFFPESTNAGNGDLRERVRALLASERAFREMILGWGAGSRSVKQGQALLSGLTLGKNLESGHIPVAAVATDLNSGERVVFEHGSAAEAIYASAALPAILPPLVRPGDGHMLVDGSFVDNAPIDIARDYDVDFVIAVDSSQINVKNGVRNGLQAMLRAFEVGHRAHTKLRFKQADYVLAPVFPISMDILSFQHKRLCIASGVRAVRCQREQLRMLLE
ncbi:MAG: NTE family protein [Gammaproteobacteria bacterium]|nr:MAG: NTE family protein [Gammaproteobacteria bacterium]TND04065.1 MAG: NTE family protein [Gammaproteobacteria bacterium]